ncbi:hypothetical protein MYX84_00755 [Acidobacteria bacterium AH-259-O06]|nr:hypothetical protein [Acidobacteria bacterium AH-259-O06]
MSTNALELPEDLEDSGGLVKALWEALVKFVESERAKWKATGSQRAKLTPQAALAEVVRSTQRGQQLWLMLTESGKVKKQIEEVHETINETYEILDEIGGEKLNYDEILKRIKRSGFSDRQELMAALKKAEESEEETMGEFLLSKRGDPIVSHSKMIPEGERVKKEKPEPVFEGGVAYARIEKRAQQLVATGEVESLAEGFSEAVTREPQLWLEYARERLAS